MGETKPTNITLGQRLKHRLHLKPVSLDCKLMTQPGDAWMHQFLTNPILYQNTLDPSYMSEKKHPKWYPSPRLTDISLWSPQNFYHQSLYRENPRWTIPDPWDDHGCLAQDRKQNTTTFPVIAGAVWAERKSVKLACSCYRRAVLLN
jgi:hypothetical protein